ncbi:malto-oligosyltrehalose synthase [Plastoroseomonas hellenica]|uniref:malto-oligosyltrehalose synthase n=1 Tax=Plastoroseomonas hellenica TaxID=2687306 RepID=UPI001BAC462A|nr:malto-oligosyltrehalose synthase [Plastoroseomonas hellenica]MBR0642250.1 malto-oligosyltrehalose synthase [Plastoroseomonas hellenica]
MTPRATARLQFHAGFTLDDAVGVVPYLSRLGISHIYASPITTARRGSTHGYDVVDPTRVNPELGGEAALGRLSEALRGHAMGLVLDIVPNHMAVGGSDNPWWLDVLEHGRASPHASWFDIDWQPVEPGLAGKLLVPFLGGPYGEVLESGELVLRFDEGSGAFFVAYHDHRFPLSPESRRDLVGDPATVLAMHDPMREDGRQRLHALLEQQHYRLSFWRLAADALNWRRFFDITGLAGFRVEVPAAFEASHALILRLHAEGVIDSVRIDHVDGLADPRGYCRKLRRRLRTARPGMEPLIWVEKILAPGETLPATWLTDGTSGYDFMDEVAAVLHDPDGAEPLGRLWSGMSGSDANFATEVLAARRQILRESLGAEVTLAALAFKRTADANARQRDFGLHAIRRVLTEIAVHVATYRPYLGVGPRSTTDTQLIRQAIAKARPGLPATDGALLDAFDAWLGAEPTSTLPRAQRQTRVMAQRRFQHLTAPLAAKSMEDTAFYRYGRLLSRNEVGADPAIFATTPERFHAAQATRAAALPRALLATATHDHKRGEDLRARLAVLSEMPEAWERSLRTWIGTSSPPDTSVAAMLLQMMVGAWPLDLQPEDAAGLRGFADRLAAWQCKALREAKRRTRWTLPDEAYETVCEDYLRLLLVPGPLLTDIAAFADRIAAAGAVNGLSQCLLRCTAPGVPDLYQGTEFWDLSLVDPDNRRAVDWAARERALDAAVPPGTAMHHWRDGHIKQAVIGAALHCRREADSLFERGSYEPLVVEGPRRAHVLGFRRRWGDAQAVTVTTRLPAALLGQEPRPLAPAAAWQGSTICLGGDAATAWRDVMTGTVHVAQDGGLAVARLLSELPVCLLMPERPA